MRWSFTRLERSGSQSVLTENSSLNIHAKTVFLFCNRNTLDRFHALCDSCLRHWVLPCCLANSSLHAANEMLCHMSERSFCYRDGGSDHFLLVIEKRLRKFEQKENRLRYFSENYFYESSSFTFVVAQISSLPLFGALSA